MPQALPAGQQVNFELSLRRMIGRRLQRQHSGTRERSRFGLTLITLIFLALVLGFVSFGGPGPSGSSRTLSLNLGVMGNNLFIFLLFCAALYLALILVKIVRWMLYWAILFAIVLLFVDVRAAWFEPAISADRPHK